MKVDKELIEHVADVARLKLSSAEIKRFLPQLREILDAFSHIDKVDTKGVKESFQPVEIKDVLREDRVEKSLSQEKALENTKHEKDGYFKGPRAV